MAPKKPRKRKAPAPTANGSPLTGNQLAFVDRYLSAFPRNATAAYLAVYQCKPEAASACASRLLANAKVRAEIDRREGAISRPFNLGAQRIRREIAAVAFSDITHYQFTDAGGFGIVEGAPKSALRAVSSIRRKVRTYSPREGDPYTEVETEVKLWDKPSALRLAAQHRGMLVNRHAGPNGEPLGDVPAEISIVFTSPTPTPAPGDQPAS